jgi:hypothetical protein
MQLDERNRKLYQEKLHTGQYVFATSFKTMTVPNPTCNKPKAKWLRMDSQATFTSQPHQPFSLHPRPITIFIKLNQVVLKRAPSSERGLHLLIIRCILPYSHLVVIIPPTGGVYKMESYVLYPTI